MDLSVWELQATDRWTNIKYSCCFVLGSKVWLQFCIFLLLHQHTVIDIAQRISKLNWQCLSLFGCPRGDRELEEAPLTSFSLDERTHRTMDNDIAIFADKLLMQVPGYNPFQHFRREGMMLLLSNDDDSWCDNFASGSIHILFVFFSVLYNSLKYVNPTKTVLQVWTKTWVFVNHTKKRNLVPQIVKQGAAPKIITLIY